MDKTPLTSDQILDEALKLPEAERADVADRLYDSLESAPRDVRAAWEAEIERRIQEIDDGTVELIPWEQARKMILSDERPQV